MSYKSSRQELQAALELQKRGIPVDGRVIEAWATSCKGLSVHQSGGILESEIFDLDSNGAGCMLSVTVCNESLRLIRLLAFRLEMPWPDPGFRWLELPWRKVPREYTYNVPGSSLVAFEPTEVLNHRLGAKGLLIPEENLDGLLLGVCERPIPENYRDRTRLPLRLSVFDTRENEYPGYIHVLVTRCRTRCVPLFSKPRTANQKLWSSRN